MAKLQVMVWTWVPPDIVMETLSFKKKHCIKSTLKKNPAGPVVTIQSFHCCDPGSVLGWGAEIL